MRGLFGGDRLSGIGHGLTCVACDHDGVLWIGSNYSGIYAVKDGKVTLFNQYNTPLPEIDIQQVFVSRDNRKWFLLASGDLVSFDGKQWRVLENDLPEGLQHVRCLCDDTHGNLWFGKDDGEILRRKDGVIAAVEPKLPGISELGNVFAIVDSMACDRQGVLWVAGSPWQSDEPGSDRLLTFDGQTWKGFSPDDPALPVMAILPSEQKNEILLGTRDGLYSYREGQRRPLTRWPAIEHPLRISRGRKGRLVLADDQEITVIDGQQMRTLKRPCWPSPPRSDEWGIALDQNDGVWRASADGLHRLNDQGRWQSLSPVSDSVIENLTKGSSPPPTRAEMVNQSVENVDILEALQNPAKYSGKKLRIVGNERRGRHFVDMVDKNGNALGVAPEPHPMWTQFLKDTGVDVEFDLRQEAGIQDLQTGDFNLRYGLPGANAPTKNVEYQGYLCWGTPNLFGGTRSFSILECYPTGLSPEIRNTIHKAYLKYVSTTPLETAPYSPLNGGVDAEQAVERLQGTWVVREVERGKSIFINPDSWIGFRWSIDGHRWTMRAVGIRLPGEFRVNVRTSPAQIDWYPLPANPTLVGIQQGVYRLHGNQLTVAWPALPDFPNPSSNVKTRPVGFEMNENRPSVVFKLERVPGEPAARGGEVDDPAALEAIAANAGTLVRDFDGNTVAVSFGAGATRQQLMRNACEAFPGLPFLESIDFGASDRVEPSMLASLKTCPRLISFSLGGNRPWTDDFLAQVSNLAHLEMLALNGSQVTDMGLEGLSGLSALRKLTVRETSATGAGLKHLHDSPELSGVYFDSQEASDALLENLARCPKLRFLFANGRRITDKGIASLTTLKTLDTLMLDSSSITDDGLASLASVTSLSQIWLFRAPVTCRGIEQLKELPDLESLNLASAQLDARILEILPRFKALRSVVLPENAATNDQVQALVEKTNLRVMLGKKWIERIDPAAQRRLALVCDQMHERWDAVRMEDDDASLARLQEFELQEADCVQLFGDTAGRGIWAEYSKSHGPRIELALRSERAPFGAVLVDELTNLAAVKDGYWTDRVDDLLAVLPPDAGCYWVTCSYENVHGRRRQVGHGCYLFVGDCVKHITSPNDLFKAYRRYQLFHDH